MLYQLTSQASKGNAFCWLTYPAQIDWKRRNDGQDKRNEIVERKRASGIDPLHIGSLSSAQRFNPKDPMRFSTLDWSKRA